MMIVADWLKRLMNSGRIFSLFCDIKNDSEIQKKSNKINEPFFQWNCIILSYLFFVKNKNEMNGQENKKKNPAIKTIDDDDGKNKDYF